MTIFNYLLDNEVLFFSAFAGMGCLIGYKFVNAYFGCTYVNKEVQTDA
jgi:hypothetical protein